MHKKVHLEVQEQEMSRKEIRPSMVSKCLHQIPAAFLLASCHWLL